MQKIFKIVGWLYRFSYKTGKDRVRAHSAEAGFFYHNECISDRDAASCTVALYTADG